MIMKMWKAIKLRPVIGKQLLAVSGLQQCRNVSALYITGDKAKENYMTLHPHMDFEKTFERGEELESSISKRKMRLDLGSILQKYEKYKTIIDKLKQLESEREAVGQKIKELAKSGVLSNDESNDLKSKGKSLRQQLKSVRENSYPIEDDFIHDFLNLPNVLHANCPSDGKEKLLYRSSVPQPTHGEAHLKREKLIHFVDNSCYYMMLEAAEFDIYCTQALTRYFVERGDFLQMANPDFVRRVLLEANATPVEQYHMVVEENLKNKLNVAYLAGGASFESFLGAMTKLCVYPAVLPLRIVACGRSYKKVITGTDSVSATTGNLFTATQTNAVQTFVAAESASEADAQMEHILNVSANFYQTMGVHFRIVYADASALTPAESLRAVIELYSPAERRFISVGHISNYTDYVSKRILFTMRKDKVHQFLHLVGGPVLYTSRLIAAMLENGIQLDHNKLLEALFPEDVALESAIDEFKSIFK